MINVFIAQKKRYNLEVYKKYVFLYLLLEVHERYRLKLFYSLVKSLIRAKLYHFYGESV